MLSERVFGAVDNGKKRIGKEHILGLIIGYLAQAFWVF